MIVAAACRLPLSESAKLDSSYHMRHRAAIGLTEQQNAIVVVVGEERGSISVDVEDQITRVRAPSELRDVFKQKIRPAQPSTRNGRRRMLAKASERVRQARG